MCRVRRYLVHAALVASLTALLGCHDNDSACPVFIQCVSSPEEAEQLNAQAGCTNYGYCPDSAAPTPDGSAEVSLFGDATAPDVDTDSSLDVSSSDAPGDTFDHDASSPDNAE